MEFCSISQYLSSTDPVNKEKSTMGATICAGCWFVSHLLLFIDRYYLNVVTALKSNQLERTDEIDEIREACNYRELTSGVQTYFDLGFSVILYFLEIFKIRPVTIIFFLQNSQVLQNFKIFVVL